MVGGTLAAIAGLLLLGLIPGVVISGIKIVPWSIVLALIGGMFEAVVWAAGASGAVGAFLTGIILAPIAYFPVRWLVRDVRPFALPILEPVYGVFFDWWLTPVLLRRKKERIISHQVRKEKRLMDGAEKKREQYEEAMAKLKSDYPEVADIVPLSPNSRRYLDGTGR